MSTKPKSSFAGVVGGWRDPPKSKPKTKPKVPAKPTGVTRVTAWKTSEGLVFQDKRQAEMTEQSRKFHVQLEELVKANLGGGEIWVEDVMEFLTNEPHSRALYNLFKTIYG